MEYKIGFSLDEFEKVKNSLVEHGFEYKKVIVGEVLRETIPLCINAVYKNPSSMRIDAPNAFSCSSLISYLYTQAGIWMPSLSIDKYVFGTPISREDLKFGDLVFSNTGIGKIRTETVEYLPGTKVPEGVDHVALYLGNSEILHATKKYGKVIIENLDNFSNIVGFRRVTNIDEKRFVVIVPESRGDLRKKENLIKEIIRK
ncbi:MAG: NlpC/P60 family protein [Patescibacteria group bacterium]